MKYDLTIQWLYTNLRMQSKHGGNVTASCFLTFHPEPNDKSTKTEGVTESKRNKENKHYS